MIELDVTQGSVAWQNARLGIPTASAADRIITAKKLEPSKQASRYLCEKLAERILGVPMDTVGSAVMDRGSEMEAMAVRAYEFAHDVETVESGFCMTDDRRAGCSVDRFVGEEGILETKNPLAPQHLEYLLGMDRDAYRIQRQFQLWVTGRQWVDLVSNFPGLPSYEERFERDEECIDAIARAVEAFNRELDKAEQHVRGMLGGEVAA